MKIRGKDVPVDILLELEPYMDRLQGHRIRENKLQSCSPFRYERHPSFAVNLDTGTWIDSGSPTDNFHKGNFVSLLAYFRQEEYQDTVDYLFTAYNVMLADVDNLKLDINLLPPPEPKVFNWNIELKHLHYRHPYLARRGISVDIQKLFLIGYDKEHDAIAMPWISTDKQIINVKYRSTKGKHFYYEPDGQLTRNYVYGLAQVINKGYTTVAMVESEIDCMYLWTNGIPAVATGHAGINNVQIKLLIKAGVKEIIAASDNDDAGERFKTAMMRYLTPHFVMWNIDIPYCYKDVNDMPPNVVQEVFSKMKMVGVTLLANKPTS